MHDNISSGVYSEIHRLMPIICVDCVVGHEGKILLVRRKREPVKDHWWFPGGRLIKNERLEQAVKRIVKCETGIDIQPPIYLGHDQTEFIMDPFDHGEGTHTVNFVYASNISHMAMMRVVLDDDHIAHSMFTFSEIYASNMHPYVKRFAALAEGVLRR